MTRFLLAIALLMILCGCAPETVPVDVLSSSGGVTVCEDGDCKTFEIIPNREGCKRGFDSYFDCPPE